MKTASPWLLDPDQSLSTHHHFVHGGFTLSQLHDEVLCKLQIVEADDAEDWLLTLAIVEEAAKQAPEANASVVFMRPNEESHRGTAPAGGITKIPQGGYPSRGPNKEGVYAGDSRAVVGQICLQVYVFDIRDGGVQRGSRGRWKDIPTMRLWLDDSINTTLIEKQ